MASTIAANIQRFGAPWNTEGHSKGIWHKDKQFKTVTNKNGASEAETHEAVTSKTAATEA